MDRVIRANGSICLGSLRTTSLQVSPLAVAGAVFGVVEILPLLITSCVTSTRRSNSLMAFSASSLDVEPIVLLHL